MTDKHERQAVLLQLVEQDLIPSQQELVRRLRDRGFSANQASISRDLRELGLVKINGRYVPLAGMDPGAAHDEAEAHETELITSVEPVGANLLVVRTPPGAASVVALQLDARPDLDIVGTVAGDDTIFVAVRSRSAQGRVVARLRRHGGQG